MKNISRKTSKIILSFVFIFLMCGIVSASGLRVINQSVTSVDKVYNQDKQISFYLANDESYSFYNVTINSSIIDMGMIPEMTTGEIRLVNATLKTNSNFNGNIPIIGFKNAALGISHQNYEVSIDFGTSLTLSLCEITLIKGDKIKWNNNVLDIVTIRDTSGGSILNKEILSATNYEQQFDTPISFLYDARRQGGYPTSACRITVSPDTGLVNIPMYNANLSLNVNVIFDPTTIGYNILVKSYNITAFDIQTGVMSITNTGNATAKNIHLSGDWFSFSSNDFDIEPSHTIGLIYSIQPVLSNTNDTAKTYNKTLSISGNFNTVNEGFNIYVPYMTIDNSTMSSNYNSLIDMLKVYCNAHPDETFCRTTAPVVVYSGNGTDAFNVTFSQDQVKGMYDYMFRVGDALNLYINYAKEHDDNVNQSMSTQSAAMDALVQRMDTMEKEKQSADSSLTFILILVSFVIVIALAAALIIVYKKKQKKEVLQRI